MANTIKHKRGSGNPGASDLVVGELAINTTSGDIFTKKSDGTVVQLQAQASGSNNADTVDNLHAASFLRSDADDTATGQLTLTYSSAQALKIDTSFNGKIVLQGSTSPSIDFHESTTEKCKLKWSQNGYFRINNLESNLELRVGSGETGLTWGSAHSTVWTAGNDGAGSGLDADTLDALQSGSFLRSDADDSFSGNITGAGTILTTGEFMGITGDGGGIVLTTNDGKGNCNLCFNHKGGVPDQNGSSARITSPVDGTSGQLIFQVKDSTTAGTSVTLTEVLKISETTITAFTDKTVWHSGNDGASSGLDADTLDGIHGTGYLRSDADDSFSGVITGGTNAEIGLLGAGGGIMLTLNDSGGNANLCFNHANRIPDQNGSSARITSDVDSTTGTLEFQVGNSTTANTAVTLTDVLKLTTTDITAFGSESVWRSGNDGSGSLLDADKLDGVEGSGYLRLNAANTFSGDITSSGSARIILQKTDNNQSDHIIFSNGTTRVGEIGCHDGTWLRINQITNKNIYTPRYFRADGGLFVSSSLKGIDASGNCNADVTGSIATASDYSSLLRANANDTATGEITFSSGIKVTGEFSGDTQGSEIVIESVSPSITFSDTTSGYDYYIHVNNNKFYVLVDRDGGAGSWETPHPLQLDASTNTAYLWDQTAWHAGNDGAGSTLDADTVDGIQASELLRSNANDNCSGEITFSSGIKVSGTFSGDAQASEIVIEGTDPTITFSDTTSGSDDFYIHVNGNSFYVLVDRQGAAGGWETPHPLRLDASTNTGLLFDSQILTVGDEGPGGGIDADTVDGLQASSFLRADTSDTATGALTFTGQISLTNSAQYPLNINGTHDGKIVLQGSNNPYIYFKEGTTNKAYIQWNAAGYLYLKNTESGDSLRIASGNTGLIYEIDGNLFGTQQVMALVRGWMQTRLMGSKPQPFFALMQPTLALG